MNPLFLIVAAGAGKRLRPETEDKPKSFVDIGNKNGNKKLIDLVMEQLPKDVEKAVLLRRAKKFEQLEQHLRDEWGFDERNILYQDRITTFSYLPRKLALSELPLAYYLAFFPTWLSRNSRFIRQYNPVVLVPGDIIVDGLDYLDLVKFHTDKGADITMPVKQGFKEGSNTRIYTIKDGRFVKASGYIHQLQPQSQPVPVAENERVYTAEGAYVLSRRFFDLPLHKFFRRDHSAPDFAGVFKSLKVVPYEPSGNFDWIDIRDAHNLAAARERYGKK